VQLHSLSPESFLRLSLERSEASWRIHRGAQSIFKFRYLGVVIFDFLVSFVSQLAGPVSALISSLKLPSFLIIVLKEQSTFYF